MRRAQAGKLRTRSLRDDRRDEPDFAQIGMIKQSIDARPDATRNPLEFGIDGGPGAAVGKLGEKRPQRPVEDSACRRD